MFSLMKKSLYPCVSVFFCINNTLPVFIKKTVFLFSISSLLLVLNSCEFLFGTKDNDEVNDIFKQGEIDPDLKPQNYGYVPILPIWSKFSHPVDVYVGYDEMIYVVDDNGVNILDLKGTLCRTIPVYKAKEVIQDRRIHTYIIGKVILNIAGQPRELAAVFHLKNTATADGPVFLDTLIHPFCDASRTNVGFRNEDLQVEFNGLATLADHTLYVARTGPVNNLSNPYRTDNCILFFDKEGKNYAYANGLTPVLPSNLKSVIGVSSIAAFAAPPQNLYGVNTTHDFLLCQASSDPSIEYRVLWIREFTSPDAGTEYGQNDNMLIQDEAKANRFLYESFRFKKPEDVYIAPDQSGYIFVVDSELDSLFIFTQKGYEGIPPPPNTSFSKNIIVSFGGKGSGAFQFNNPCGVCYYRKTVYVADRDNNRIIRFRLNTDLE